MYERIALDWFSLEQNILDAFDTSRKTKRISYSGHLIRVFSWLQLPVLLLGWLRFLLALNASDEMSEPWMDATGNIWRHPIEN